MVLFALCLLQVALLATGCAKAKAASAPEGPPLAVPAPPPRVLAPVEEPLAENPPAPEEPTATPPRTTARPAPATPPRRPPSTPTTTEPEPKPEQPAAPAPVPAAAEPPVTTPRPVPTQADAAAERKVREVMRRAAADLGRVNYQRLSADGRAQYELSKRFSDQAEQALKDRNYAFASTLADKAGALATELLAVR